MTHRGCTILTPFLAPFVDLMTPRVRRRERSNVGDGFILRAITRLIEPAPVKYLFTCRAPLTGEQIEQINETSFVLLAGANQLDDRFSIVPGMTPELFRRIRVPVIPMGIGLHGQPSKNTTMTAETALLLRMMHERIAYSSWRCPQTVKYLVQNLPELAGKALMTGCPVQYQPPILKGTDFTTPEKCIAVTVTDRGGKFWNRETAILRHVAREFPTARRILSLHQDFRDFKPSFKLKHLWAKPPHARELYRLGEELGYELFFSETPEDFFAMYKAIDGHFGSRLHAHLYLMGNGKASYLIGVDERCTGIAEASDFPLYSETFDSFRSYDFARYQSRVRQLWPVMERFLRSLDTYAGAPSDLAAAQA